MSCISYVNKASCCGPGPFCQDFSSFVLQSASCRQHDWRCQFTHLSTQTDTDQTLVIQAVLALRRQKHLRSWSNSWKRTPTLQIKSISKHSSSRIFRYVFSVYSRCPKIKKCDHCMQCFSLTLVTLCREQILWRE